MSKIRFYIVLSTTNTGSFQLDHTDQDFTRFSKKGVQVVFISLTLENTSYTGGLKESVQQKLMSDSIHCYH